MDYEEKARSVVGEILKNPDTDSWRRVYSTLTPVIAQALREAAIEAYEIAAKETTNFRTKSAILAKAAALRAGREGA